LRVVPGRAHAARLPRLSCAMPNDRTPRPGAACDVQHNDTRTGTQETRSLSRYSRVAEVPRPVRAALPLGATPLPDGRLAFRAWAPRCRSLEVELAPAGGAPVRVAATRAAEGYYEAVVEGGPGLRYRYVLDGERARPDPAARALPDGVH